MTSRAGRQSPDSSAQLMHNTGPGAFGEELDVGMSLQPSVPHLPQLQNGDNKMTCLNPWTKIRTEVLRVVAVLSPLETWLSQLISAWLPDRPDALLQEPDFSFPS